LLEKLLDHCWNVELLGCRKMFVVVLLVSFTELIKPAVYWA
jgi:hypothetical protein